MSAAKSPDEIIDLLVVGLGPAGAACALQALRDGLSVAAVSEQAVGGLLTAARRLDNFPGLSPIAGRKLADMLRRQLERESLQVVRGRVERLEKPAELFEVSLADSAQTLPRARAVVLAVGTEPRPWKFSDRGPVHRDIRGLDDNLSGRRVLVIGGGEAALDSALSCRDRQAQATVLIRGEAPRAVGRLVVEAEQKGVALQTGVSVSRVAYHAGRWQLRAEDGRAFSADHLLVCIGRRPRLELLRALGARPGRDLEARGCRGVFLAGDVVRGRERYAATAVGDGQRAALAALAYLRKEGAR